jgi:hypothetical protein
MPRAISFANQCSSRAGAFAMDAQRKAFGSPTAKPIGTRAEAVQRRVARPRARLKPRLAAEVVGCTRATGRMQRRRCTMRRHGGPSPAAPRQAALAWSVGCRYASLAVARQEAYSHAVAFRSLGKTAEDRVHFNALMALLQTSVTIDPSCATCYTNMADLSLEMHEHEKANM